VVVPARVRFPVDTALEPETPPETLAALAEFYTDLDGLDLQPLWTQNKRLLSKDPRPSAVPWLWRRADLVDLAKRSEDLITISRGGDRRVLALANPGLQGQPFATNTLWGAVQRLGPHESAPGHRHTPGAVRFVMEGEGASTTVDGDCCEMHEGDLVLTPPWHWHDHRNTSDTSVMWFDGLDLPLVRHLDAIFFESYDADDLQPVLGLNLSEGRFTSPGTVPADAWGATTPHSPLLVYRYSDANRTLDALLGAPGQVMATLDYVNPTTGGSVMPTLGCSIHRILPGARTATRREVGSSIYVVFKGSGMSVINGERFEWSRGDIFVVPSWAALDHEASEPSDLFSLSDVPVIKSLGLYRERTEATHQDVTGNYTPRALRSEGES
jgi:gentisate 1,2-dioxygenase